MILKSCIKTCHLPVIESLYILKLSRVAVTVTYPTPGLTSCPYVYSYSPGGA